MAKKVTRIVKLQLEAGKASPAPPVGTVLGPTGINMMDFCKQFNDATKDQPGMVFPAVISIYEDRTFTFVVKTPPAVVLIKKAIKLEKGSAEPNKNKVGTISLKQVQEIAELKMKDLNSFSLDSAIKEISGTARSMGILVKED